MRHTWLLFAFFIGCSPLAAEHQGDAAFRKALSAQLAHDDARAEVLYQEVLSLGLGWSPVWNNLAVIAVHRHQYSHARRLLAHAVEANERDVVALTNYGVVSYHLYDFAESKRALAEARALRLRILALIPSLGRAPWEEEHYARATADLDAIAAKYLARIDQVRVSDGLAPRADAELVAERDVLRF